MLVYEGHEMALARGILSLIMPVDTIVVVVVALVVAAVVVIVDVNCCCWRTE